MMRSAPTGSGVLPPECDIRVDLPLICLHAVICGRDSPKPNSARNSSESLSVLWPWSFASIHACISGSRVQCTVRSALPSWLSSLRLWRPILLAWT